ncbi:hypothetical protein LX15_005637 [Streptoalloteichus tenebrarius]|uniref:Integral membrane protein n=1 Tax=Streptoalloteichus tenebrarius (strain ATCC 17920 / DSM 40477 / JCM 4838 / CBS 697.72 / NBRC 16177 / NCIMB 11028 / NRRL B-12390 / A12253. 1 / ISP 5477) TaxID=1933 RepID=A0ABT1I2E3_STRSD|nr:hypothetical protein [Streptoalloteichus tenebrarius]MCP2261910.1 hypothetical protein [Streptoalloteichus tenebrarius]
MSLVATGLAVGLLGVAFWMLGHWARCIRPECRVCGVELADVLVPTSDGGFVLVLPGPPIRVRVRVARVARTVIALLVAVIVLTSDVGALLFTAVASQG